MHFIALCHIRLFVLHSFSLTQRVTSYLLSMMRSAILFSIKWNSSKKNMKTNWKLVLARTLSHFWLYILRRLSFILFSLNVSAYNCAPKMKLISYMKKTQYAKIKTIENCIESNIHIFVIWVFFLLHFDRCDR